MNGVKFGDKHSITDWDLIMTSKSIGTPEPKTNEIEIPGRDGVLEIPDPSGEVKYSNRPISFTFDTLKPPSDWWELDKEIANYLHGKKLKVILDQDPNYYYIAKLKKEPFSNEKNAGHISISGTAEPYKYKKNETVITKEVTAGNAYEFINARKSVVPVLTLSKAMTIIFNGTSYSLGAGSQKVLGIKFIEGINTIEVTTGNGTLTVSYQEADL